jgi:hypothetical protein
VKRSREPMDTIAQLLRDFISGRNRSIEHVNRIESLVEAELFDDPRFEPLVLAAARYRPSGGDQLVDESGMEYACREALVVIQEAIQS